MQLALWRVYLSIKLPYLENVTLDTGDARGEHEDTNDSRGAVHGEARATVPFGQRCA